jgi:hypothetical protein
MVDKMVPVPCKSNRKDKELKKRYFTENNFFYPEYEENIPGGMLFWLNICMK